MIESIITKIILSLVKKLGVAAREAILTKLLEGRVEDRQEERKEISEKIEMERIKPVEEQNDDTLRDLHRRLRSLDS